jgi:ankyrin repeat protein
MNQLPPNINEYPILVQFMQTVRDIDKRYIPCGETLLQCAALNNHMQIVQFLVKSGADVNLADNDNDTPLHKAARRANIEIVEYLIKHGANINALNYLSHTPLHTAAIFNNFDVVACLLKYGTDTTYRDHMNLTAAECADEYHPDTAEYIRSFESVQTAYLIVVIE